MEQALFAPGTGYYSSQVPTVGRHGDFSTSTTISSLLGRAVAAWLVSELSAHPGIHHVIEVGGGGGSLSAAVRDALGWWKRRRLHWHMVETSAVLAAQQADRLQSGTVTWHDDVGHALDACGGRALIFHNELVDAFQVRVLQWNTTTSRWDELWMKPAEGTWLESFEPLELTPADNSRFSALRQWHQNTPPPSPAQRVELHAAYHDWLGRWAPRWHAGAMLTMDYGDVISRLYHRQPRGTVRAYFRHQRLTGPDVYARMGKQDITTDVNFTDLMQWGAQLGWENAPLQTQRDFLLVRVPGLTDHPQASPGTAFLLDEHGAGTAFKVLIQRVAGT